MYYIQKIFSGRMSRRQFTFGYLYLFLATVVLLAPFFESIITGIMSPATATLPSGPVLIPIVILGVVIQLLGYGMMARRLHDIGQSAWWLLVSLVPYLSVVFLVAVMLWPGQKETNTYGEVPGREIGIRRTLVNL